ncbi:hypothetical protein LARV_03215 [Longilinea arvoryzae]|uniref:DUF5668 domain-containing protein n=1 Tax=Longilinea arvoryzae TaxID=360412 RepID=A0A0S7BNJ3_9CHLR|nr:DUF5668 domain-containing protein [Longilinea arvoryzae]GAP15429.1 hypothetical protein LARV_03215 [Longilinea arvoryzae]
MAENQSHTRHSIFWPLMLVAVGIVLLLTNLNALSGNLWDYVARYWPLLFILGGLDQIYQGKSWVGAVIMLGLGGVLLAGNFNALPWSGLDLLLRLWPVIIVAAGLDLMMQGRSSALGGIVVVVLAVALVAGMIWIGFVGPGSTGTTPVDISQPLEGAQSASMKMTFLSGDVNISGDAEADQLIQGTVMLPRQAKVNESYSVSGGEGRYVLEPAPYNHIPLIGNYEGNQTELKINNSISTDLDLTLIAGKQDLDLQNLKITDLKTETIFGQSTLILPENGELNGKAGVIFGELVIRVPRGTSVEFILDTVLVGKNIPQDFVKEEDRVYSPGAANGNADIVLTLEDVFGAVKIEYLP